MSDINNKETGHNQVSKLSAIDKIAVGKRIKKIRESLPKDNSFRKFGNLIIPPISGGGVKNWENGVNLPSYGRFEQIAEIGNVTTDYLLYGKKIFGYGECVRQIRKENNLSKEDLAKRLNQDKDYIENIELENEFPTKEELIILANIGNTTWEKILWSE